MTIQCISFKTKLTGNQEGTITIMRPANSLTNEDRRKKAHLRDRIKRIHEDVCKLYRSHLRALWQASKTHRLCKALTRQLWKVSQLQNGVSVKLRRRKHTA